MLDRDLVLHTIESLLGRPPVSEQSLAHWRQKPSLAAVVSDIVRLDEYAARTTAKLLRQIGSREYFRPTELQRSVKRDEQLLLIGACFTHLWPIVLTSMHPECRVKHIHINHSLEVTEQPAEVVRKLAFQIVHIPARFIFPDRWLMDLVQNRSFCSELLEAARTRISVFLDSVLTHNRQHGLLSFISNLIVPQFNLGGRLLARYSENSVRHFFEQLNRCISDLAAERQNCYVLDMDALASSFGKRYLLDDSVNVTTHNGFLEDFRYDQDSKRLEVPVEPTTQYQVRSTEFIQVMWDEIFAAYDTVRQSDPIKLVVTDLDDTLWRGLVGEAETNPPGIEGWPLGYIEALLALKGRGVLLGVISKNTEEWVRSRWEEVTSNSIKLDDFAAIRINWDPKPVNMEALLKDVSLLPKSVLYIDDNPVERAAIAKAFPGIRVLGSNPYVLKRVLLLSPETQVPVVTAESGRRTEMIQAQVKRKCSMQSMSRGQFLASLQLELTLSLVLSAADTQFARSLELLNKTNQFNTTGRRWSFAEITEFFGSGGRLVAFDVADVYTQYGLVGVLLVRGSEVLQFAMSCRVIGLDIETAAVRLITRWLGSLGATTVEGAVVETAANTVCRDVYKRSGFSEAGGRWCADPRQIPPPAAHIAVKYRNWGDGSGAVRANAGEDVVA